jgi:peptidoglycan/xylan/chitin deacetylase (PgdA/CDA1 family)
MSKTKYIFIIAITIIIVGISSFWIYNKYFAFKEYQAGVIISFDDHYVSEWLWADSILQKYHWKASFNLSNFDKFNDDKYDKLRFLQSEGHELACHGLNHLDAIETIQDSGVQHYIDIETLPMINIMKKEFGGVSTFVYPYGNRNKETDKILLNYFSIVRGTTWFKEDNNGTDCYFKNGSHEVDALGIDANYEQMSIKNIKEKLEYTRDNKRILVLYAHVPCDSVTRKYQIHINTLEYISKFINKNNMRFYTFSDLDSINRVNLSF